MNKLIYLTGCMTLLLLSCKAELGYSSPQLYSQGLAEVKEPEYRLKDHLLHLDEEQLGKELRKLYLASGERRLYVLGVSQLYKISKSLESIDESLKIISESVHK